MSSSPWVCSACPHQWVKPGQIAKKALLFLIFIRFQLVCVCFWVCMSACICVEARSWCQTSSSVVEDFWRNSLSLMCSFPIQFDWLASKAWGSFCLHLSRAEIIGIHCSNVLFEYFLWVWRIWTQVRIRMLVYQALLPTDPFLQLWLALELCVLPYNSG